jgi:hypothetical protein
MATNDKRPVDGLFTYDGKQYGWAMPTIRENIAAAAKREFMCGGFYGQMSSSPSGTQQGAASQAMMVTELELYVVQYPKDEPEGFSHLTDTDTLVDLFKALKDSVDPFRKARQAARPDSEAVPE